MTRGASWWPRPLEDDFMRYYNEYKRRLNLKKKVKRRDDDSDEDEIKAPVEESASDITTLRTIKNPSKPVEAVIYLLCRSDITLHIY